ncbi:DUF6804 family protein [Amnibacterium flavum]|uniref:Uncharacterized protein n=1 Tax=Amnibacterium flavum TaxID=2173173 RepID=A0A2V1HSN4_9MICO|nr:DUF6804 family protein [Amnibacterium flavum]PVZ95578.1 hypothetical protein DDQ50_03525 [Amnibacterium flavum]
MTQTRGRPAFLPAILCATALIAGIFVLGSDGYLIVRFAVAILALIVAVIAMQNTAWPWALPAVAVAIIWNPIYPFDFSGTLWAGAHVLAAAALLAIALLFRAPVDSAPAVRRRR